IGASIRLRYGERLGPARLVTAGAGYWSQDGLVQVLGRAETPSGIDVRWPGGKMTTRTLGATDQEILLTSP
ncbi:MAG TPA: ASPIC/UnbV domain-containing protein, partial [Candidatus Dormibacteraeota bacterium]|nr:ASPIC/UnbV domain-containing protein [Candidatus Dormibacteraeota bacterium]